MEIRVEGSLLFTYFWAAASAKICVRSRAMRVATSGSFSNPSLSAWVAISCMLII